MNPNPLHLAFVTGLSDNKLKQFLRPLQVLDCVQRIDLYRRRPLVGEKIHHIPFPAPLADHPLPGDLWRLATLLATSARHDVFIGCFQLYHGVMAHMAARLRHRPAIQLIITDVDWNMERPWARLVMLRAAACGVMGPVSLEKLRKRRFAGPIEMITLPHRPLSVSEEDGVSPRFDCLAVGSMAEEKDYPWMLEVFTSLCRRLPSARLAMAGAGLEAALGDKVSALGLGDNVRFLGLLDDKELASAYAASRLLVMTSKVEGLPMVAVEAMSYGRPVVATAVGDLPWLVRPGLDGCLVPHGDTSSMVQALEAILTEPSRAEDMGRHALGRFNELLPLFTTETVSRRWESLLMGVVSQKLSVGGRVNPASQ